MSLERLHTKERRQQMARAALAVIGERGLRGLSVAAVARRVGVVPSALYRHFRGKDELLVAALEAMRERLHENIRLASVPGRHPLESLREIIVRHAALIRENAALPRILFADEIHAGKAESRARVFRYITEYISKLEELIRHGQELGQIRRDVDARDAAFMCLGLVQPPTLFWLLTRGDYDADRQIERAWGIFSRRVLAPDPDGEAPRERAKPDPGAGGRRARSTRRTAAAGARPPAVARGKRKE
jgi:AcrR family transcriptional regulator